jgi:hypothetical protein
MTQQISSDKEYILSKNICKIPVDVFLKYIIPYTYSLQPSVLLKDIRNYYHTWQFIEMNKEEKWKEYYVRNETTFDGYMFLEIENKMDYFNCHVFDGERIFDILRRYPLLSKRKNAEIVNYILHVFNQFSYRKQNAVFWGLLSPDERDCYINRF